MDELSGLPLDVLTPAALLGLAIFFIMRGVLVPRQQVERQLADKDAQIAEKNTQLANKDEQLRLSLEHNSLLLRGNETTMHLIESLPAVVDRQQKLSTAPPVPPAESGTS